MTTAETRGVSALAELLRTLAAGGTSGVAGFAEGAGIARSTGFAIVRKAETAGFVRREEDAALRPGPEFVRLAWAAHGVGALHGPAEPVCATLRDETGWSVRLWSAGTPPVLLLSFPAPGEETGAETLDIVLGMPARARLTLHRPPSPNSLAREGALRSLREAAAVLVAHLDSDASTSPAMTPAPARKRSK